MPKASDFQLVEEPLGDLANGEIITETLFLSVDPYMRPYIRSYSKFPMTMIGEHVAKVTASKDPAFPVGSIILSKAGWVEKAK